MNDKCFCHLNGYRVKDAEAREKISTLEDKIENVSVDAKGFYNYKMNLGNISFEGETNEYGLIEYNVTELCKTEVNELVNKWLKGDVKEPVIVIENTNTDAPLRSMMLYGFETNYDPEIMQSLDFTLHGVANYLGSPTGSKMKTYEHSVMFGGAGIVKDGVWDARVILISVTTQQSLTTDNTIEYVPTGDYNPATKKYVDDAIANIDLPEGSSDCDYTINYAGDIMPSSNMTLGDTNQLCVDLRNTLQDIYDKKLQYPRIRIIDRNARSYVFRIRFPYTLNNFVSGYVLLTADIICNSPSTNYGIGGQGNTDNDYIGEPFLQISANQSNDIISVNEIRVMPGKMKILDSKDVLLKTNTLMFTPSNDYHPATKKYVDDSVNATTDLSSTISVPEGINNTPVYKKNGSTHCIRLNLNGSITSGTKILTFNNSLVGSNIPYNIPLTYSTDNTATMKYDGYAYINASDGWAMYVNIPDGVTATNVIVSLTWID